MKKTIALLSVLLIALSAGLAFADATLEDLPLNPGSFPGYLSPNFDGTVIGLNWGGGVGYYTAEDGVVYPDVAPYGLLGGGKISGDGSTLTMEFSVDGGPGQAGYYDMTDGAQLVALAADATECGNISSPYATNFDGSIHVGLGWFNGCDFFAYYWEEGDEFSSHLEDAGDGARPNDINGDGTVIGGWYYPTGTTERTACMWNNGVIQEVYNGASEIYGVSHDGTKACGWISGVGAMYWDNVVGAVNIGTLPGDEMWGANGYDISNDGKIVGQSGNQFFSTPRAFIWTLEDGMMYLGDYLEDQGVEGASDIQFYTVSGISDDGNTIVGAYVNEDFFLQAFVARLNGPVSIEPIEDEDLDENNLPAASKLVGAYPNPFNPMTSVKFALDSDQHVSLYVYDVNGRQVAELANRVFTAGEHSVVWQGRDQHGRAMASGNYLLRMVTGEGVQTSKMMLVR